MASPFYNPNGPLAGMGGWDLFNAALGVSSLIPGVGPYVNQFLGSRAGQHMLNVGTEQAYQDVFNQARAGNIQTANQMAGLLGLGPLPQTSLLPQGMPTGYQQYNFGGPGGGLLGALTQGSQQLAQAGLQGNQFFNPQAATQRFGQAYGPITQGYNQLGQAANIQGQGIVNLSDALAKQGAQQYGGLVGGYQNLGTQAMDLLRGAGAQERADINRQFNNAQAQYGQGLFNRGFAASTVGAPGVGAIERARSDALGAADERIRQQTLNTLLGTQGNLLGAQERGIGFGTGLQQGAIGARQGQQQFGANLGLNTLGALGGIAGGGLGYQNAAAQQGLTNLGYFGQIPLNYLQSGVGMGLNFLGGIQQPYPQYPGMIAYQQSPI